MAQLIDIKKVTIDPVELAAKVRVANDAPLLTSEDPEATARVLELVPGLVDHVCLGDDAPRFGSVIDDTELAHLLEHVTVELVARTGLGGEIEAGRTTRVGKESFVIRLACPDDVLVCGALSSAVWILEWAYSGGGEPAPDVDAVVEGLRDLVASVSEPAPEEGEGVSGEGEPAFDSALEAEIDLILSGGAEGTNGE